jgi:TRAP transporter 4TM/12TM fusion protein
LEKKDMQSRILDFLIAITGLAMVIYHAVYSQYLLQGPKEHQIAHLGVGLLLLFLLALKKSAKLRVLKILMLLTALAAFIYLRVSYPRLEIYGMLEPTNMDIAVGVVLILLCMEATRQSFGLVVPLVAALAIAYMLFGSYLPNGLFHAMPLKPDVIIQLLTIGFADGGIFGPILGVSATYIFLFMVFAALVQTLGANEFFNQVGNLVGRRVRSGPAMAAVVTSGLVGSISGQSGPNVMITGSYTIPAMKKAGYKPEQAGAIEAAASTGGPIIPPIMGIAAFLMSGMTGIPYYKVIGAAVLPALFYVFACAVYVQLQAAKLNIRPPAISVDYRELILRAPLFICPLLVIIVLFIENYTPMYVSFWACVTMIIMSMVRRQTRPSLKSLMEGLINGASIGASIAAICAVLGLVVAAMSSTGLGVKLPAALGAVAGQNTNLLLVLTGLASLILGIGMPASASYLLVAIVLAPVLVTRGIPLLAAHLFAFYLANFSYLTPPVALSAVFAARLAGGNFLRTAIESAKVGIGGFILPFMIVWVGALTWNFSSTYLTIIGLTTCVIIIVTLQGSMIGYFTVILSTIERLILGASSVCLMIFLATYEITWFVVGVGSGAMVIFWAKRRIHHALR